MDPGDGGCGMAAWVGALDGGGTKTASALADRRGGVTILPALPGCSPQDGPAWEGVLGEALGRMARAGLAGAVLGMPGRGEVPAHDAAVDALAASIVPGPREVMNDVALARLAAFGGGDGVLLLSGTGSMAWARGPAGEARVGGWGDVIGDEGSAYWIGREALAEVSRAFDGRVPMSGFARTLCERLGATGDFAPLSWLMAQQAPRAAVAGVAREVDDLAEEGDGVARALLAAASEELTRLAMGASKRVGLPSRPPWVAAGSVFRSAKVLRRVAENLGGPPSESRLTTLAGGLLRAAEIAGWAADDAWAARVDARLRAFA